MEPISFVSHSLGDSERLGHCLGAALCSGVVVALNGQLGAGKTTFVRSVCDALGNDPDDVSSPTFVLLQLYTGGKRPVAHFDTYRLGDVDEFLAIGGEDFLLDAETVCFVEWAERISEVLPGDRLSIDICHTGETSRTYKLVAGGEVSGRILSDVRRCLRARE